MRRLLLDEHRTTRSIPLSTEERDLLLGLHQDAALTITRSWAGEGLYDLSPSSTVGTIALPELSIEIRPKLPVERLLFLLSYSLDPARWRHLPFGYQEQRSLLEAFVPGFVAQVERALQHGVLQGYRQEESALQTVRGRIRFDAQVRDHFGLAPPIELRFDEFDDDIVENRLLKAAISRLGTLRLRSRDSRRSLRRFDRALERVSLTHFDSRALPDVPYTRLNERYRPAVELAKLVLRSTSIELGEGAARTSTFLIDMNRLFEDFLVVALREALRLSERSFPQGAVRKRLTLDTQARLQLKPDMSWWEGDRCLFVGDAKYKRTQIGQHPDLYQLLAYIVATDLEEGLLIYAAGEDDPRVHTIRQLGRLLHVITLDLAGPPEAVLKQVTGVASEIRRMRDRSRLNHAA